MTSRDYEVATTSLGKWYTGGRGFSLPAIGHEEVLVEEKANSTDQGGALHQVGKLYTGGFGFSLQTTDLKRDFDKTENQEKTFDQRQHKSLSANHRSENQTTKDDQKSFEKLPNKSSNQTS